MSEPIVWRYETDCYSSGTDAYMVVKYANKSGWRCELDGEEIAFPETTREAAKAACQTHADRAKGGA